MARHLSDDDQPAADLSPFRPLGPAVELDAFPAARAITAVAAAMDPDWPQMQVELYSTGVIFVGTDTYSYLTAYVPYPAHGDWTWEHGIELAADRPRGREEPRAVIACMDSDNLLPRWAALYAKAKRAKDAKDQGISERISIQCGARGIEGAQPALSDELTPQAVRFAGPDTTTTVTRSDRPFIWRHMEQPAWAKPVEKAGWVRAAGRRHAQIGKLGALDPIGLVATRAKVLPSGGWVIEVSTNGYPAVEGHMMASRSDADDEDD